MSTTPSLLLRLCIGHRSEMLDRPTAEGHTHRWTVFVRSVGTHQFVDRTFVTKVVFELHPDFANPHRVVKEPPFEVTETGYAGFTIPVNVSFSGTSKTYRLHYDMNLCLEKQSEHKVEQILEIKQPSPSFSELIMKYGGVVKREKKKDKHRVKERGSHTEHHRKDKGNVEEPRGKERKEKTREQLEETKTRKEKATSEERAEKKEKLREQPPDEVKHKKENGYHSDETTSAEATRNSEVKEEAERRKEKEQTRTNNETEERDRAKRVKTCNEEHIANKKMKLEESDLDSLVALQRKLMTLCDVDRLQAIVDLIVAAGPASGVHAAKMRLNDDNLLSFDLCALSTSLISQFDDICSRKLQSS